MLDVKIIEKGAKFDLTVQSKQASPTKFYFGAGWDNPNGPVDLDIVAAILVNGKLTKRDDMVFFGNREVPRSSGVFLSKDNTTGEGDGDDEHIIVDTSLLPPNVDSLIIGLAAYDGTADLVGAPNAHFRVCDGDNEQAEQIGEVKLAGASAADTVVTAFKLTRSGSNWDLENLAEFHKFGNGNGAVEGFFELTQ